MLVRFASRWAAAALACLFFVAPASAQEWPKLKQITLVSPYPPGGTNDIVARLFADKLAASVGQSVVVENRAGAAGAVGSKFVAQAAPDGYTLISTNNGAMIIQPLLNANATYDPLKDFTPVTQLAAAYLGIGVHKSLPATTMKEFVTALKASPGKYFYGSSGAGSFGHFNGEYFKATHGLDATHVPFRGSAAALTDLIRGEVHFMMDPLVLSQAGSESVRILAVTNPARIPSHPDIPTIAEAGFPEFNLQGWFGVFGPPKLPKEIADKITAVAVAFVRDPEVQKKFEAAGIVATAKSGKDFEDLIANGKKTFADIQKSAKIVVNQ